MSVPLYDRLLARYAPEQALSRARARAQAQAIGMMGEVVASIGGYDSTSGKDSFLGRWTARPRSAAADTMKQLPDQRGQSRDLVRNHPLAASAINTNVARAIGTGLAYSPQPHLATLGWSPEQGAEWGAEVSAEFSLFADSKYCDWYGEQNFWQLQDLVTRARLESGDAFTVLPDAEPSAMQPYALRLQVLEADRVGNPRGMPDTDLICGGIRRPEGGGPPNGVHVYRRHPGSGWLMRGDKYAGDWIEPVGPSGRLRILHHFKRMRPELQRGVPYLAPVIGLFKLLGDYTDAEVKAAVISAWLTMVVETPTGTGIAPIFGMTPTAAPAPADATSQPAPTNLEMGPGHVLALAKGEKASFVNPARPNPSFGKFVEAVLDYLGAGTFIGSEMLLKKFSTSYTAARAAWLDAWKHLLDVRTQTAWDFCQPVVETWMAEAVYRRRIRAPGFFSDARLRWAYTRAAWHGDSQGSLNPKDEVTAFRDAIDGRLTTHERASWELFGTDWRSTVAPTLKTEIDQLQRDGIAPVQRAGAPGAATPEPPQPTPAPPPDDTGDQP